MKEQEPFQSGLFKPQTNLILKDGVPFHESLLMEPYRFSLRFRQLHSMAVVPRQPLVVIWQNSSQNMDISLVLNNFLMLSPFRRANRILEL